MFHGSFSDPSPRFKMSWEAGLQGCPAESLLLPMWEGSHISSSNSLTTVRSFCFSSPFKIKVLPAHDASKVRASGPGLNASGIPASLPVEFTIDARDAGEGLLTVQILVSLGTAPFPAYMSSVDIGRPDLSFSSRIPRVNPRRPTSETMGMAHTPCPTCQT